MKNVLVLTFSILTVAQAAPTYRLNWVQLHPAAWPSPRGGAAMAYDWVSRKVVLFGGYSGTAYLGDTWTFDGANWTMLSPAVSPPARTAASMAFDSVNHKLVMFGGYTKQAGYFGDTWIFDGSTGTWEATTPSLSPPAVTQPMAFHDPLSGYVDVYGGFDGKFFQLNTWQWTGADWVQLHPANSPTARAAAIVAEDHTVKNRSPVWRAGRREPI